MQYSPYQQAIFDWIDNGRGDGIVEAVAGSGKTTTLVAAAKRVDCIPLFAAFNVSIVKELRERLGSTTDCRTINSIGHGALVKHFGGHIKLEDSKYRDIVYDLTETLPFGCDQREVRDAVYRLASFVQSTLSETDPDSIAVLCERYDIELPISLDLPEEWFFNKINSVLDIGKQIAKTEHIVAFNDQIWLPNIWNLSPKRYQFVLVDECQDLSRAKLELILKTRAAGGRMLFVGDPRQSIYGFAGADPRAWHEIIERTQATVLPLSVCYRCPSSHVDLAKTIVPQIEAKPDAEVGVVQYIEQTNIPNMVKSNDLILCRTTAPLIRLCLELIAERIPARVAGSDIGKSLVSLAREAQRLGEYRQFPQHLRTVISAKIENLKGQRNTENKIKTLEDREQGLLACFHALHEVTDYATMYAKIGELFSDQSSLVTLSTVHRAKGLEANRVFLLRYDLLGKYGKQDWQIEQEMNLKYVALTRAKSELFICTK